MKRLSVVFLTMFFLLVAISAVVQAQTMDVYYAYLPASGDGSLSVVNLNTMIVEKTLPIGTGAYNINVSPKRKAVYVVNTYSKTITDINTETKIVRRSGNFGNQPYAVIVDDAENYLYVSDIADNKIYEINLNSFSKEREWTTSIQPVSLALDKQNRLWVANSGSSTVTVISLTDSSKTDINVGQIPFSVVFHPTKNEAYISCIGAGSIDIVDTQSLTVKSNMPAEINSYPLYINLDGSKLYASCDWKGIVQVFNLNNYTLSETLNVGGVPEGIDSYPGSENVFVVNALGGILKISGSNFENFPINVAIPYALGKFITKEVKQIEYYNLQASIDGQGTISADGLTCNGENCTGSYLAGSNVIITAVPGAGLETRWTGCSSSNGNTCTVFMNTNKTVQAQFYDPSLIYYTFAGYIFGEGSGTLVGSGIICNPGICTGTFLAGTEVYITPDEDPGSIFAGWTDCDTIEGEVCKVIMNTDRTVYAQFDLLAVEYTKVKASPKKLSFGSVKLEEVYSKVIILTNVGANEMFVSNLAITGVNAVTFSQSNNCNSYIPAGGQCQITVNFQSYVSGKLTAAMEITVNSLKTPIMKIGLKANVKPPKLKASPSSVSYKSSIGTPMVRTVTLQNKGLSDLDSISVRLTDDLSGVFSFVNHCGATLLYGQSCTVDITFTSKTSGEKETANLLISSNDPVKPEAVIRLSGTGK